MRLTFILLPFLVISSLAQAQNTAINSVVDAWHQAAAQSDFNSYFNLMTDDAIFIGTDATENWTKDEFQAYAKPHFDKGKAWSFHPLQRNIFFSKDKKMAWFDELLDTQMKICRGSGVLVKVKNQWKIAHYVLSISIPNELSKEVIELKTPSDDILLKKLKP